MFSLDRKIVIIEIVCNSFFSAWIRKQIAQREYYEINVRYDREIFIIDFRCIFEMNHIILGNSLDFLTLLAITTPYIHSTLN